ncbi:MAG TPA: hypothetical protein VFR81_20420 [Longimicrobium sp.]|nr:hypothetical protein [Longimicrobium sp.]
MQRSACSMVVLVAALASVHLVSPAPTTASLQTACPAANEPTRRVLARFLTSVDGAPIRLRDGFAHVSAANVRLLTDATDSAVCLKLRDGLVFNDGVQRTFAFYEADGFYFVATVRPPANDGMIHLGFNPLIVLTRDLQVVGAYTS